MLYTTTPRHKVVAIDGGTGHVRWTFDSGIEGRGPNRGVTFWGSGADARIFTTQGSYVYAISAQTGRPITTFGRDGRIDLRDNLGRDPSTQSVFLTTPGVVYQDLLIVGGRVSEALPASPGDIRAYDVRSGALRWTFHTIPHPGEAGYDTWPADAWTYSGGANNWAGMALDTARGIVYAPTGSAASDFYGANRIGDDLFANTLLALDAETGKRLWHFQAVHHDIWDRDFPSPPTLVTVGHDGRRIDAVAQTTKHGYVFVFDRTNGQPIFPIESRRVAPSTVDGERAAESQPFPSKPAPFARQRLTEDMLTTRTPEAHAAAVEAFRRFRSEGQFLPLSVGTQTVVFPGFDGGAEWGGSAFDPGTGLLYVNANEMAWTGGLAPAEGGSSGRQVYLRECATCHRDDLKGAPPQIPSLVDIGQRREASEIVTVIRQGAGRMPAFPALQPDAVNALVEYLRTGESERTNSPRAAATMPYRFTGYRKFLDQDGYPGHTQCDQSLHRRPRVVSPARRIPGARREGDEKHRQRELRWANRHSRRPGVHWRDELRPEVSGVRCTNRRAALGNDAAVLRQRNARHVRNRRPAVHCRPGRRWQIAQPGRSRRGGRFRRHLCRVRSARQPAVRGHRAFPCTPRRTKQVERAFATCLPSSSVTSHST